MSEQWSREGAGLIIQETSRAHHGELKGRLNFRVPSWIQQIVTLPDPIESMMESAEVDRDVRRLLRKMKEIDITSSFSTSETDFHYFYHRLYLPFIVSRHGEYALVTPYEDMLRWFRRGGLIVVHSSEDSRPLAGVVVYLAGKLAYAIESGFVNNQNLWKLGLNPYLYWSILSWAASHGAKQLDLGGSFPVRTHGVFTQKRRWGAKVAPRKRITTSLEFIAGQLSPDLEDHINEIGLITEIQGKNYGLVLNCHHPVPAGQEISNLVRNAVRDGLAGIALLDGNGARRIFDRQTVGDM
jgi:hypothetical protein